MPPPHRRHGPLQELYPSHPRAQPSTARTSRLHHTHTCRLVWVIEDGKGQKVSNQHRASASEKKWIEVSPPQRTAPTPLPSPQVGGLGTAEEPYLVDDHWVFERAMADDGQWQIKHRVTPGGANTNGSSAGSSASGRRGPRK